MTEEEKQEFAVALATRYRQVKAECARIVPHFIQLDIATTSREDFKASRRISEKTYADWVQLANVIADLPLDIKQVFDEKYLTHETKIGKKNHLFFELYPKY